MNRRLWIVIALSAGSVIGVGCAVFASKSEYASYREYRIADGRDARLEAAARYIKEHPTGRWHKQIMDERIALEPEVWEASKGTREGLEFYLRVYPDAPHAAEAQPRLAALRSVGERRESERERAEKIQKARLEAQAEARRTWVTRAVGFWTKTLSGIRNWGQPIPAVARENPDFSRAFGQPPRPRCSRVECVKYYYAPYAIPVPGATRIDRQLELMLRLRLQGDGSNVERAELLLPNKGFSRWFELENRTVVTDEDPTQRQQAIEWALERIQPAVAAAMPDAQPLQDFVPEPIDPPTISLARTGTAETGDTEADQPAQGEQPAPPQQPQQQPPAPQPQPQPQPQPAQPPAGGGGQPSEIDQLLNQAAGQNQQPAQPAQPEPEPQPEPPTETLVLPIAVRAWSSPQLRVVIFAAPAEDYGTAYDGFFIERIRAEPAQPAGGGPTKRRPGARPGPGPRGPAKRPPRAAPAP